MYYKIAGLIIEYNGTNTYFIDRCEKYRITSPEEPIDMNLLISEVNMLTTPEGVITIDETTRYIKKTGEDRGYYIVDNFNNGENIRLIMDANETWDDVKISNIKTDIKMLEQMNGVPIMWHDFQAFLLAGMAFKCLLNLRQGVNIHSSAISYKGEGIIFSAPSGTGKSTHTRLWRKLYEEDVIIVNDDKPAIRFINDTAMLCGTPWSGSSDEFTDDIVPLKGIVFLAQSPINTIEKLNKFDALKMLIPNALLPYFDQYLLGETMSVIDKLIARIPMYKLNCRPDFEAVELVRACLM